MKGNTKYVQYLHTYYLTRVHEGHKMRPLMDMTPLQRLDQKAEIDKMRRRRLKFSLLYHYIGAVADKVVRASKTFLPSQS